VGWLWHALCRLPLKGVRAGRWGTLCGIRSVAHNYGMGHVDPLTYIILKFVFDRYCVPSPIFTFSWFRLPIEASYDHVIVREGIAM
jgi:hypothetical protein